MGRKLRRKYLVTYSLAPVSKHPQSVGPSNRLTPARQYIYYDVILEDADFEDRDLPVVLELCWQRAGGKCDA